MDWPSLIISDCGAKYWIGNTGLEIVDFKTLNCNEWKWGHHLVHISDCEQKYWIGNTGLEIEFHWIEIGLKLKSKHWIAMNWNEVAIWYISLIVGQNTGLDRPQIGKCFPLSQKTIHSTRITRLSDNKVQNKVCRKSRMQFCERKNA